MRSVLLNLVLFAALKLCASDLSEESKLLRVRQRVGQSIDHCIVVPQITAFTDQMDLAWSNSRTFEDARRVAVRIRVNGKGAGQWELRIFGDDAQARIFTMKSADVVNRPFTVWTDYFDGRTLSFELHGDARGAFIEADRCSIEGARVRVQNILDKSNPHLDSIQKYREAGDPIYGWGRSVARLTVIERDGKSFACTAFLVTNQLLLTARHCFSTAWEKMTAEFNVEKGLPTNSIDPVSISKVEARGVSDRFDYALLRLTKSVDYEALSIPSNPSLVFETEKLIVIQHAGGEDKTVARDACFAGPRPTPRSFPHHCDTESGSSGSPVLLSDGSLIGIHTGGFNEGLPGGLNWAISISQVLDDLKAPKYSAITAELRQPRAAR